MCFRMLVVFLMLSISLGCSTKQDSKSNSKTEIALQNLKVAADNLKKIEKAFDESPIGIETNSKFNKISYDECVAIGNGTEYCECYAKTLTSSMGHKSKKEYVRVGALNKNHIAFSLSISMYRFNACEEMRDMPHPDIVISERAQEILRKNEGHIVTPNNRLSFVPNVEAGYEFAFVGFKPDGERRKTSIKYSVAKVEGNKIYISYVNSKGEAGKYPKEKYEHLTKYERRSFSKPDEFVVEKKFACVFEEGKCTYLESEKYRILNANSKYVNGLWMTRIPGRADETIQHGWIFKDDGLPLYHVKKWHDGSSVEMVRVDPQENPSAFDN